MIGPDNTITNNRASGVAIDSLQAIGNTITANSIYGNEAAGIWYNINDAPPYTYSTPPVILHFDLEAGTADGQACRDCVVEVFSTDTQDGKIYEGIVTADAYGVFSLRGGKALSGPFLTATSSPPGLNTSEFSPPTPARSAIQIAFEAIQQEAPLYQTGFDTWEFGDPVESARLENGRLILTSGGPNVFVGLHDLRSDRLAVEFDLRIVEPGPDGLCYFGTSNDHPDEESQRSVGAGFGANGLAILENYVHPHQWPRTAERRYDQGSSNRIVLTFVAGQIGVFVDGQVAYAALDPNGGAEYARHSFSAEFGIECEFDNYSLWDLSGVDFNP